MSGSWSIGAESGRWCRSAKSRPSSGRSHGNTVRIPSAEVSRQHCRLSKKDGLVMVRDLGSVNGTLLNGTRISAEEVVRPGDRVEVGPVTFVVEYELTPEALAQLHGLDAGVDVLSALADGEVVEDFDEVVPPSMEVDFDMALPFDAVDVVEEVEDFDEVVPVDLGRAAEEEEASQAARGHGDEAGRRLVAPAGRLRFRRRRLADAGGRRPARAARRVGGGEAEEEGEEVIPPV